MPDYRTVPFKEAISYLQAKQPIPTDNAQEWLDSWHDAAFIVSGMKGRMTADVQFLVENAIASGMSDRDFAQKFAMITDSWAGGRNAWRANIVFRTNQRMAYAAGRYSYQLAPSTLEQFPYLQFVHSDHMNYRPLHKALDGKVFEATKIPFSVPSGFGCGCRYISIDRSMMADRKLEVSRLQRGDEIDGETIEPDSGFDYRPGQTPARQRELVVNDIIKTLPPKIAAQVKDEIKTINATRVVANQYLSEYQNLSDTELLDTLNALEKSGNDDPETRGKILALKILYNGGL